MLRLAVEECPEDEEGGTALVYTGTNRHTGNEAFTITERYRGEYGFATGLDVYDVVRVGDLLLVNWAYGEGGGSDENVTWSQRAVTDQSDNLLPEMCEYAIPACSVREPSPVVRIGPDGIDGVTLGMSAEAAAEAGLLLEPRHDGSGCTVGTREEGTHAITADIRPGVGVVTLSVSGTEVVTPEEVGTGMTSWHVYTRYLQAHGDESKVVTPVPGRPEAAYWFWLDEDEFITGVMLMLPDQRCYG